MSLSTFLRKELAWSKHRLATIVVLFVLVPAIFATGTLFFEHTLPENSPVAVVPGSEDVSADDVAVVTAGLNVVSDPRTVESRSEAFTQLHREEVYAIVEVPPGMTSEGTATIDVHVDGGITIFRLPSRAMVILLSDSLDGMVPATVEAERHVRGEPMSLAEYLLPTFVMILVMLVAFVFLPASLAREERVFDRLRTKSSMGWVIAAKLLFVGGLLLGSLLVAYAVGWALGYSLQPLSPIALLAYLLAYVVLASIAVSISLATDFSATGRVLNVAVFFALIPLSNLAYPAGFFSELSKTIARHNPLHYAMIVARSHLLKETTIGTFGDWLAGLVAVAVVSLGLCGLAVAYYERTR